MRAAGERFTWRATARNLLGVYEEAAAAPPNPARLTYFGETLSDVGLTLVGPGGYLSSDAQRALLAVAARRRLRRPVLGGLEAAYRGARRVRRRLSGPGS